MDDGLSPFPTIVRAAGQAATRALLGSAAAYVLWTALPGLLVGLSWDGWAGLAVSGAVLALRFACVVLAAFVTYLCVGDLVAGWYCWRDFHDPYECPACRLVSLGDAAAEYGPRWVAVEAFQAAADRYRADPDHIDHQYLAGEADEAADDCSWPPSRSASFDWRLIGHDGALVAGAWLICVVYAVKLAMFGGHPWLTAAGAGLLFFAISWRLSVGLAAVIFAGATGGLGGLVLAGVGTYLSWRAYRDWQGEKASRTARHPV